MKISEWGIAGALLAVLVLAGNVRAEEGPTITAPEYLEYLAQVREGLEHGEPRQLSEREQHTFDEAHGDIRRLLAGKDSISELHGRQMVTLFNSQERINAILTGTEADELICRREAETGSHFRETRCATASQRQEAQEAGQELLRRFPAQTLGQY